MPVAVLERPGEQVGAQQCVLGVRARDGGCGGEGVAQVLRRLVDPVEVGAVKVGELAQFGEVTVLDRGHVRQNPV
nr:hypothetical protein [Micromonospora sp. DSM 115978]